MTNIILKNIKVGTEVVISVKNGIVDGNVVHVSGKVLENNFEASLLRIDDIGSDTIIRYDQIEFIEVYPELK